MKFGGTSVGDALCIRRAAEIVAAASGTGEVVVVVSAMSGVTNRLITAAHAAAKGDERVPLELAAALRAQHAAAIDELIADETRRAQILIDVECVIDEAASLCRGVALARELSPRNLDSIAGVGERLSARVVAGAVCELNVRGAAIEANELIVTNDDYGQAEPLLNETRVRANARLAPLIAEGVVPVVTGFIGATIEGVQTTLGRGGSDYSATILGAALDAAEVIIWTDVDGVMTADPRLVKDARTLREISYNEAAELAFFGAKVLHPKTLRPITEAGIPVWIRNSFAPERMGTKITLTGRADARHSVKAVTAINHVSLITVGGRGIVGVIGIAAQTFTAAASVRANVLLISQSSSENDICFIVDARDAERTMQALRETFAANLAHQQIEHVTLDSEIAIVAVVGEKMRGTPGIAGRTFSVLGRCGINIIAIAQGSSEYNVSFVVKASEMQQAIVAVHNEFNLHRRDSRFELQERALAKV